MPNPRSRNRSSRIIKQKPLNQKPITLEQIAQIYASLKELEDQANKANFPLTTILHSALITGTLEVALNEAVQTYLIESLLPYLIELSTSAQCSVIFLAFIGLVFSHLKVFKLLERQVKKVFPNGVGFSCQRHSAYSIQDRSINYSEAETFINELTNLLSQQSRFLNLNKFLTAISLLLPFIGLFDLKSKLIYKGGKAFLFASVKNSGN